MKAGILFGSTSGTGEAMHAEALLSKAFRDRSVAVCSGRFGGTGDSASWTALGAQSGPGQGSGYLPELRSAVASLIAWGADILVCVGGDGLASYAADAMLASPRQVPLLGVAAGTINVGPIVTLGIDALAGLDLDALKLEKVSAVEVLLNHEHLAYGFNDIVIGDTFLGTLDGQTASLSVKALLESSTKAIKTPSPHITGPDFSVRKNGRAIPSGMRKPSQIIVSPLGAREFYARAVTGVLCNAAHMRGSAGLALFDSVIVKFDGLEKGLSDFSACEQLLFGPGDLVEISGLTESGQIVVDGNPFFRTKDVVQFRVALDLVDVARLEPAGEDT